MAKKKKEKGGFSSLPFPIQLALKAAIKKKAKTEEEREKVMEALEKLDLNTLLYDPDALARVMSNPSGELGNFMVESGDGENAAGEDSTEAVEASSEPDESGVQDEESAEPAEAVN